MNKQERVTFSVPNGLEAVSVISKESFDSLTKAFSGWMRNANHIQAEAMRFVNDRFNKDVQMLTRFGHCKAPEDFVNLQAELAATLMTDYMEEGAKMFALFSDASKAGLDDLAKSANMV